MAYEKLDQGFIIRASNPVPATDRVNLELLRRYFELASDTCKATATTEPVVADKIKMLAWLWAAYMHDAHVSTVTRHSQNTEEALVESGIKRLQSLTYEVIAGATVDLVERIITSVRGDVIDMQYGAEPANTRTPA